MINFIKFLLSAPDENGETFMSAFGTGLLCIAAIGLLFFALTVVSVVM